MKEMCMQLVTSYKECNSYGHVSEFVHDAWLNHTGYTVDEKPFGRYFSRRSSAFLTQRHSTNVRAHCTFCQHHYTISGNEKAINPLTPELNPFTQRCLTGFFSMDFTS
jgi:hypothetical protein